MAGELVRKARLAAGLSQAELAERMRVRQATVSKLESGEPATRMAVFFDALTALGLELVVAKRGSKADFGDLF
ncbi:XRE family transcriptional regulator [Hyphomonas jannaschiana VP2]|jgi:HTH-type transcriptional regulator/antitoxin HipB|uniref:XRE family transcriptional regulator n=3 Tax=Alphaproteobacteria TaxID=28211 RepID=A0A059FHY7_9PROT|nr:XRE family transcriptional regulator [Hyphomonas jannaschiana VP2]